MADFRKLLLAQMVACNDFDGGWPSVVDEWIALSPEDLAAYAEVSAEAYRLLQDRGSWKPGMSRKVD